MSREGVPARAVRSLAVLLAGAACAPAHALEVLDTRSGLDDGAFTFRLEARVDVPVEPLARVLTDFDRIHELHRRMVASRDLGEVEPGVTEVYTELKGCVAVFCRTIHRTERVRRTPEGLFAEDVPGRGDFEAGSTRWTFIAEGGGTRVVYETSLVPGFWVPPLLGPSMLADTTRRTTIEMLAAAERKAGPSP